MPKFRKKPVIIEAYQLPPVDVDATFELLEFLGKSNRGIFSEREGSLEIHTLEGIMIASPGDWIIKGIQGEFYPCKPDIFEETYDLV